MTQLIVSGLLIFSAVADPRNSGKSTKIPRNSLEILSNTCRYNIFESYLGYRGCLIAENIFYLATKNSGTSHRFLAKFAQKIPTKSAVFYRLFFGEVSPETFRKSVSENPAIFAFFFATYQKPCSMAWSIRIDCLKLSWTEVGINLEVKWLCLCDLAHFLRRKQSKIR